MKLHKSILISIVIIGLLSCSPPANEVGQPFVSTPDIGIDVQNQKHLEVTAPDGWNSFRTDKPVSLLIQNISDTPIVVDSDFDTRIFVRSNKGWIEVANKTVYLNESAFTLEPNKNFDVTKTVSFLLMPDLPDNPVPSDIRIYVVGTLIENESESKKVASYIDLKLKP